MAKLRRHIPLFETLDPAELELLQSLMREESYPAGRVIFHGGDDADALYLILQGQVSIAQDAVGRPMRRYAVLGAGDFFGEMGLLNDTGRLASAHAKTDVRLCRLPKQDLAQLMQRHPVVELKIRTEAIRRHHANAAKELERGQREKERIRIGQPVSVKVDHVEALHLLLDNLSVHGCCLRRVPESWTVGRKLHLELGRGGHPRLLSVAARVAWRRQDQVGMSFVDTDQNHAGAVKQALRVLLGST